MNVVNIKGKTKSKYSNTCTYVRYNGPSYQPEICGKECMRDVMVVLN